MQVSVSNGVRSY